MIQVSIVNRSKSVSNTEVAHVALALNTQAVKHFYPTWGIDARVSYAPQPVPKTYRILVMDDSDVQNALGYHDFEAGVPTSKVFARTTKNDGGQWSVTASHELLEMLVDPEGVLAALRDDGTFFAYEICDPVETQTYSINGVNVSNFALPSWFANGSKAPYDYLHTTTRPFQIERGGYMDTLDASSLPGWQQVTQRTRRNGDAT